MHIFKFATALALTFPLAACSGPLPMEAGAAKKVVSAGTTSSDAPPGSIPHYELHCDGTRWALLGDGEAARVQSQSRDKPLALPKPDGMEDFVPVGMGCAQSSAGGEYLVVGYGEAWLGCNICEWFFVYDREGRPLNHSVPPMIGEMDSLYPNNEGYTQVTHQLQLERPDIYYPPRARPSDAEVPSRRDIENTSTR
ncbi:hypothetical protein ACF3M1_00525 [Luteimonas sp. WGS1318]|uniref:hypothetical protein n=1 Tax=Luteimonas sp. WGS1318 TaxID=3366815 RepID=UPI00372D73F6